MRKQFLSLALACGIIFTASSASANAATAQNILINGTSVEIPVSMGSIREQDDRTFIPVRFLSEYLGCAVNYSEFQESATITDKNGVSYLMQRDSNLLYVLPNTGMAGRYRMDTKVFVDDTEGRMYIPIRFFAQALGYTVGWDAETATVSLDLAVDQPESSEQPEQSNDENAVGA